jgi:hypothetical protein
LFPWAFVRPTVLRMPQLPLSQSEWHVHLRDRWIKSARQPVHEPDREMAERRQ